MCRRLIENEDDNPKFPYLYVRKNILQQQHSRQVETKKLEWVHDRMRDQGIKDETFFILISQNQKPCDQ